MTDPRLLAVIGIVGILLQLGGALLLVILFVLLRPHSARRTYFTAWRRAWLALALAIAAVVVRYIILGTGAEGVRDSEPAVRALYFIYQLCKITYCVLLVAGTVTYARGVRPSAVIRVAMPVAAVYALVSVLLSQGMNGIVMWQSPITVFSLGFCASVLLTMPVPRRSLGARVTGAVFALIAVVWAIYFVGFSRSLTASLTDFVVRFNGYVDLMLQMLLGYGMVVMLLEDAKREVDDAHAELAVAHDQLRRASLYDSLTGSLNRQAFAQGVGLETARGTYGAVAMLDLDNLKVVNDSRGHAAGDELLQHLADAVRSCTRPSDRFYRWGGDEFIVVFPGARAATVQSRLEDAIASAPPVERESDGGPPIALLASVGAADFESADDLTAAIDRADAEMYRRKEGRKRGREGAATAGVHG